MHRNPVTRRLGALVALAALIGTLMFPAPALHARAKAPASSAPAPSATNPTRFNFPGRLQFTSGGAASSLYVAQPLTLNVGFLQSGQQTIRLAGSGLGSHSFKLELNVSGAVTLPTGATQQKTVAYASPAMSFDANGKAESAEIWVGNGMQGTLKVIPLSGSLRINWVAASALPVKFPMVYMWPNRGTITATGAYTGNSGRMTDAEIVNTFDLAIWHRDLLRRDEFHPGATTDPNRNINRLRAAGFRGSFLQYMMPIEINSAGVAGAGRGTFAFEDAAEQDDTCASVGGTAASDLLTTVNYSSNPLLEAGDFCQVQDSRATGTAFNHDLNAATPTVAVTESWFLHNPLAANKRYVRRSSGFHAYYPNPANPGWRQYFEARVYRELRGGLSKTGAAYAATGADGLYLDNIEIGDEEFGKINRAQNSDNSPPQWQEFPALADYKTAVVSFTTFVTQRLRSEQYPAWGNLISGMGIYKPAPSPKDDWAPYRNANVLQGAMNEFFLTAAWNSGRFSAADVRGQLRGAQQWLQAGKRLIAVANARKDTADAAELSYSLAGLLLTTDGENGYFFFRNDEAEYSAFYDSPLYDNRLGRPLAAADLASDTPTYQRAFDCGSVQLAVSTVTTQPLGAADSTITYDPSCANTVTQAEISGFTAAPTFSAVSGQYAPEMRDMATGFFDAGATLDALMLTGDYDGFHIAFMAGAGNGQLNEVGRFTYDAMNQYGTYYTDPPSGLAVADLSNDGKQDFAVGFSLQPRVDVFYGDGAFGFAGPTSLALPAGFVPQTISLSDLNGDGRKDVIVGSSNAGASGPISIFLATGATSFGPRTQLTVPGSAFSAIAAAADVNADGKQDLLYANAGQVGYALGNGDGTFAAFASASPGTRARDKLRVADLNYDGYVDLLVSAQDGMQFFAGSASGPVLTAPPSEQGRGIRAALGDFNRDGSLDIVSTDGGATIRLNHGNATFASSALPYPGWAEFAETGDFNGDGKADIVQTTRFYFYVYLNTTP